MQGAPRRTRGRTFTREERAMTSKHWGGLAAYGLPGLVVGLALAWWSGGHGPTARAQGALPATRQNNGTLAFTSASNGSSGQLLYLIDTENQAFAVYRVDPANTKGGGSLKLEAARQYKWDLKLSEFNNQSPEVSAVEGIVKSMTK